VRAMPPTPDWHRSNPRLAIA